MLFRHLEDPKPRKVWNGSSMIFKNEQKAQIHTVVTKNNLLSEIGSDVAADFVDSVADNDLSGIAKEAAPSLQLLRVLCPSHISSRIHVY